MKWTSQNTLSQVPSQKHIYEWTQCSVVPEARAVYNRHLNTSQNPQRQKQLHYRVGKCKCRETKSFSYTWTFGFPDFSSVNRSTCSHSLQPIHILPWSASCSTLRKQRELRISSIYLKSSTKHNQLLATRHHCDKYIWGGGGGPLNCGIQRCGGWNIKPTYFK